MYIDYLVEGILSLPHSTYINLTAKITFETHQVQSVLSIYSRYGCRTVTSAV